MAEQAADELPAEPEYEAPETKVFGSVLLHDRYSVDPNGPLKEFSTPSTQAFRTRDLREPNRELFTLICSTALLPRVRVMASIRGDALRGMIPLIEWDTIFWPPIEQHSMAVIYEYPLGGSLMEAIAKEEISLSPYELPRRIIQAAIHCLTDLSENSITHRSIRPDNIFMMDAQKNDFVFGDCVSTPPGYDQPVLYEPIDRGMASPAGRGMGNTSTDLYALGVTLIHILVGDGASEGMTEEEILLSKIEHGSYATLAGNERIPPNLLEPLRGMLSDDPMERWGLEELEQWLNGRQLTPIQRKTVPKVDSLFMFSGREYSNTRSLALSMSINVAEAARKIQSGEVEIWIRRILANGDLADAIAIAEKVNAARAGDSSSADEVLVAKVCILLDPTGPVRYKGLSFIPEGFGAVVSSEYLRHDSAQIAAEVIKNNFVETWIKAQPNYSPDLSTLDRIFSQLMSILASTGPGFGIERCMYELNPGMPCQSPMVVKEYVSAIDDLLPALERIGKGGAKRSIPMDRHIAAFIAARYRVNIEPQLDDLASGQDGKTVLAVLNLLALLQWRQKKTDLFALTSWIGGMLGPAIRNYHSRKIQKQIEKDIPAIVRKGDLPLLFDLVENQVRRRQDDNEYAEAQARFAAAEAEIQVNMEKNIPDSPISQQTGEQAAAMFGIAVGLTIVLLFFTVSQ